MERMGDLMEQLGFKKEADDVTKAAFIKNLIKQAYGFEAIPPRELQKPTEVTGNELISEEELSGQLSFKF